MSFQSRSFYTVIIGLPVVNPNPIPCFELSIVSDATRQNAEWITQKVMCVPSQLWVQSFDFLCLVTLFGLSEKILFYYIQVDKTASSQVSMLYRLSHRPYSKPTFYGNEVGIGLRFPLKIRLIQYLFIKLKKTVFLKLSASYHVGVCVPSG